MKTITNLPDMTNQARKLKVLIDLENEVNENTLLGFSIKLGFKNNKPASEIIAMIKDQMKDNRRALVNIVPDHILADIDKYF